MLFIMSHAELSMIPHAAVYRHELQQLPHIVGGHLRCTAFAQPEGSPQVLTHVGSL